MSYGTIKVNTITFTNNGVDQSVTVSGIVASTSGNLTVTGTVSGATASFTSGGFTNLSGGVCTITSGVFAQGTVSNPSISFNGDVNTGIYSPNAEAIGFTTNGQARFIINGNGQLEVSSIGSSSLPAYTFGTDPGTGLYSPGAGQLALATNGAGRLFVTSDGKVGVGITPSEALHVAGNAQIGAADANTCYLEIGKGAIGNRSTFIDLTGDTTYSDFGLRVSRGNSGANTNSEIRHRGTGGLILNTQDAGAIMFNTTNTERLRITSAGLVGVGTSSPKSLLHVAGDHSNTANSYIASNLYFDGSWKYINNGYAASLKLANNAGYVSIETAPQNTSGIDAIATLSTRLVITPSGNVGIGTTTIRSGLHIYGAGQATANIADSGDRGAFLRISQSGSAAGIGGGILFASEQGDNANSAGFAAIKGLLTDGSNNTAGALAFSVRGTSSASAMQEAVRIDGSGRLLVGTSTALSNVSIAGTLAAPTVQIQGGTGGGASVSITRTTTGPGYLTFNAGSSGNNVASGNGLGAIQFNGFDGTNYINGASISAIVDGTPGANDMPGRLVFSTTADGASNPTERARITSGGYFKASNNATYISASSNYHEFSSTETSNPSFVARAANDSFASAVLQLDSHRTASNAYAFLHAYSDVNGTSDLEFALYGDGNGKCDGAWTGGGADYAEYFEWSDGNPDAEDRRGISVVLDGDKIRPAVAGEDPIGVISGNPSIVGDAAWNKWRGKYLRDDYGTYILEDYEVEDEDGNTVTQQRPKLNPAYDPDVEYTSREERPEWDCVGLMGKLRIRKGQPTGSRWIKMRNISDSVEEWLVR